MKLREPADFQCISDGRYKAVGPNGAVFTVWEEEREKWRATFPGGDGPQKTARFCRLRDAKRWWRAQCAEHEVSE